MEVSDVVVQPILNEVSSLHVSIAGLNGITGCDGEVNFQWWCEHPEGWEGLGRIAEMLESLCPLERGILYPPDQGDPA